jgi:hypothetical protein
VKKWSLGVLVFVLGCGSDVATDTDTGSGGVGGTTPDPFTIALSMTASDDVNPVDCRLAYALAASDARAITWRYHYRLPGETLVRLAHAGTMRDTLTHSHLIDRRTLDVLWSFREVGDTVRRTVVDCVVQP